MKIQRPCLLAAALLALGQPVFAAEITGKITLKGTPPPETPIPLDPQCGAMRKGEKLTTQHYRVGSGGELADVFVYLKEGAANKPVEASAAPVVLDQVGCLYTPYVFGIQAGQKLVIKNSDPVLHNIHVTPDPKSGNKESNQAQLAKGPDLVRTFDNPEVLLRFKCDVHPWMFAYAGVLPHPYFAVSGKDGTYKIANVPAGKYVLELLHRKAGKQTKEITVGADTVKADFTLEVPAAGK